MTAKESNDMLTARIEVFVGELRRAQERLIDIHLDTSYRNPETKEITELFEHLNEVNTRIFALKNAWYG